MATTKILLAAGVTRIIGVDRRGALWRGDPALAGVKAEYAERMTQINPMIRLVTIPDAGHLVHCRQPAAFTAAVLEFL